MRDLHEVAGRDRLADVAVVLAGFEVCADHLEPHASGDARLYTSALKDFNSESRMIHRSNSLLHYIVHQVAMQQASLLRPMDAASAASVYRSPVQVHAGCMKDTSGLLHYIRGVKRGHTS